MTQEKATAAPEDSRNGGKRKCIGDAVSGYLIRARSDKPLTTLSELAPAQIWAAWREEPNPKTGRMGKPPINPETGWPASTKAPKTWGMRAAAEARAAALHAEEPDRRHGVGVMLGRLRDRIAGRLTCLSANWFLTLADAREKMEAWRRFYNEDRPHSAIGYKVPIALTEPGGGAGSPP